jgi:hypothetical protein
MKSRRKLKSLARQTVAQLNAFHVLQNLHLRVPLKPDRHLRGISNMQTLSLIYAGIVNKIIFKIKRHVNLLHFKILKVKKVLNGAFDAVYSFTLHSL